MRLIRSWPIDPPANHPRIEDNCERVYIPTIDYRPLADIDDDIIHLDWDVAVSREDLRTFADRCKAEPELVRTAPTMTYASRQYRGRQWQGGRTRWMVWRLEGPRTAIQRVTVEYGEPFAHLFSFGMIYLPKVHWQAYVSQAKSSCSDMGFGQWYHFNIGRDVPLDWDISAVHINYSIKDALEGGLILNDVYDITMERAFEVLECSVEVC